MKDVLETIEQGDVIGRIFADDDPGNPRTEWDNGAHMVCWHRRYCLGDAHDFSEPADFEAWAKEQRGIEIAPLFLYDHSGITISMGRFSCPWDSGQVGYIYMTREDILCEYGKPNGRVTRTMREKARALMEGEVQTYDEYITGQVYGYTIEDRAGNEYDSCWNFFGWDYTVKEVTRLVEHYANKAIERCIGAGI